jgi:hypothetical protein
MTRMQWVIAGLSLSFASVSVAGAAAPGPDPNPGSTARLVVAAERSGLRPEVLQLALEAYARATARHLTSRPVLTVIDYSLPSREKRLWVLDVRRGVVLAHELVAHGRNTGDDLAERFSNLPGSLQSSLGAFLTGGTYSGKHGLSLRLRGLEKVNDRAEARAIVVHGADYVNDAIGRQLGRLGRSQGCPALSRAAAPRIILLIQGGTILFAYHPSLRSGLAGV